MLNNRSNPLSSSEYEGVKKAGDIEPFPSGKITYLSPLPLPAPIPPYGPHIGELNQGYMDFGLGSPQVFSWQVIAPRSARSLTFSIVVVKPCDERTKKLHPS